MLRIYTKTTLILNQFLVSSLQSHSDIINEDSEKLVQESLNTIDDNNSIATTQELD